MINKINLNYDWLFKETFLENDLKVDNKIGFISVNLPHTNKEVPLNNFDETISQFVSIYKKKIFIEDINKIYHLVFEGVAHFGKLFINGQYISEHHCGYTRWKTDITPLLKKGDNEISVVVDSREIYQPPFGFVIDYLCFGGIYRECYLEVLETTYFTSHYFHYDKQKWFFDYEINKKADGFIKILIKDQNTSIFEKKYLINEPLTDELPKIKLWDIDNPYLYSLKIELYDKDNHLLDCIEEKIGFRYIEFKENGFFLNDKKVKIRGANRHQSYPYVGYAMPRSGQEDDALILKNELKLNAVRTSHYPQSPDFLNKCDEIGLLVFEEIPGWQFVGDEKWQNYAIQNVKDMIIRDRHHPSIILWGVRINESGDNHSFYTKTNEIAHQIDPYRPTGGVRCSLHSELLEDVYTYNDFICGGNQRVLRPKDEVTLSNKPYLISEYSGHMYPTKSYDNETRRTEVTMIHSRVLSHALQDEKISGTFAWCFADYNTHKDFGSGDLVCYHGICDIFRNPKFTAYAYQRFSDTPFLQVTSNFNIGENNGGYIRNFALMTNCDKVEIYHDNNLINSFVIENPLINGGFIIDDLLGNQLIEKENKNNDQANLFKTIIKELLILDGVANNDIINKYSKEMVDEAWQCYGKYVANWGSHPTPYTFIGYKNNIKVVEITRGAQHIDHLKITTSKQTLITQPTYDVARITIEAIGNLNNRCDYSFDSFTIESSDGLEVIGDDVISLIAGVRSFYIKTTKLNGEATITIKSKRFGSFVIPFTIKEK